MCDALSIEEHVSRLIKVDVDEDAWKREACANVSASTLRGVGLVVHELPDRLKDGDLIANTVRTAITGVLTRSKSFERILNLLDEEQVFLRLAPLEGENQVMQTLVQEARQRALEILGIMRFSLFMSHTASYLRGLQKTNVDEYRKILEESLQYGADLPDDYLIDLLQKRIVTQPSN